VGDALRYFDGDRYDLDSFVVMPNHVHVLVQFRPNISLTAQTESWLRYTARQINARLGRRGEFWQSEPFYHLVRSAEQFEYLQRYIAENPQKAHLHTGEYLYRSVARLSES
jgi:REP element-mobilizing transposase RayT